MDEVPHELGDGREDEYYEDDDGHIVEEDEEQPASGAFATPEEAEEAIKNIGQTPMLDSVQEMLRKQQLKERTEKELALKEVNEDFKRAQKAREDLGVRLYGLQQQLANSQIILEETHNDFVQTTQIRFEAESAAKEHTSTLQDIQVEAKTVEDKLTDAKREENAVKAAVKQVEAFLEETRGEIAVVRRATHKTEESVSVLEKKKQEQDLYIDERIERIAQLQEELSLVEAQRESQRLETKAAEDTLQEASKEMQTTLFEKKQVVQQWNSTLIALQRRDEAYQAVSNTIQSKQEELQALRAEIEGYKVGAGKVQFESEKLVERKVRQEHSLRQVEEQLVNLDKAHNKLSERYSMMKKSLDQQDGECRKLKGTLASWTHQLKSLQTQIQLVNRERFTIEEKINQIQGEKTTMSKAAKNLSRESGKVFKVIHGKEMEIALLENEMSRVKIDKLNTQSHTEQLDQELNNQLAELKEKDKMIEKYKMEIRQRHDEIEKKMYVVDRLNRKFENMCTNADEPENLGPLEATIKNLTKETTAITTQSRELERTWLKLQTEYVQVVNEMEQENTTVHELTSSETILEQKKKRLGSRIRSQTAELKDLDTRVRRMHNDMHKLNEAISEHKGKHDALANSNEILQTEFINELKELEQQSVQAESKIESCKLEKQSLLDQIMESERQIKLWEKKIQLEKETQQALDPTVGQSEVKSMEREIHRMKIRYDNLTREQEKMIKEMEVAILKRETIATRKKGATNKASPMILKKKRGSDEAIAQMTQAELVRKLKQEKKEAKRFAKECLAYEGKISAKLQESENISMELEKASSMFASLEDAISDQKKNINEANFQKQRNIEHLSRLQSMQECYIEFTRNPAESAPVSQEEADIMLDESQDQLRTIVQTLKKIEEDHPHLQEVLERVAKLVD